ncbi:MAG TPA: succinylglutamate desuccinylase/aspartoacylase family protein [Acidimicrobiales bacterium]|nr:succinylglutamate desuccinylase/aspartoacylase family protein [Acidimicrobiales bacterium]
MVSRHVLEVPNGGRLPGASVPYLEYGDRSRGPSVALIAGVHGCEYSSMLGLRRFLAGLDEAELQGHLVAVPIANLASFHARQAFTVPHDQLNLNRCFPGNPEGSFTERLAWVLFETIIRPADRYVDMHCGDQVEELASFALYDASPVEDVAEQMAQDYGLDFIIRVERSDSPVAGTGSAAAAEVGIPAITAEAGGRGIVEVAEADRHVAGLRRIFGRLGLLPAPADAPTPATVLHHFLWMRADKGGWWEPAVVAGEEVAAGQRLGTIGSLLGGEEVEVTAPEPGFPLFITSSPAVADDGLLLGLGVR